MPVQAAMRPLPLACCNRQRAARRGRTRSRRFCTCPADWGGLRYGPYRVPRPSACDLEFARHHGDDVAELDEFEVESELAALVRTLALLPLGARPLDRAWLLRRRRWLLDAQRIITIMDRPWPPVPATSGGLPQVHVRVVEVL
jgi:hypothetical protein